MVRTQVRLTDEQARGLRRLAADRGVSVAKVIREAVERYLAEEATSGERRQRAVAAIGGFHSGLHDVGEAHDRHLTDA